MTTTQNAVRQSSADRIAESSFDAYLRSLENSPVQQASVPKITQPTPQEIGRRIAHDIIGQLKNAGN